MFSIDPGNKTPIYRQIIDQFLALLANGVLQEGDALPSIRELAENLGINPNTIARSYREMEKSGLIETIPKKGSYVSGINPKKKIEDQARKSLEAWLEKYLSLGLDRQSLKKISEEIIHA